MAAVDKRQGDDIVLTISGTDAAGDAMNIDNLAELFVYVVNTSSKIILAQFSKAGAGSFTAFKKITPYIYSAIILSALTLDAQAGYYDLDINVVVTDADFNDSEKNTIGVEALINLRSSISKVSSS